MKKDESVVVEVLEVVVDVIEVREPAQARDEQRSTSPTVGWSRSLDANWERTFGSRKEMN